MTEKFRKMCFTLADTDDDESSQFKTVQAALMRAMALTRSDKLGHNLVMICIDFLATNDFVKPGHPERLARYLSKLEQALPIRIIAVDPTSGDVIFGMQTLARLANDDRSTK